MEWKYMTDEEFSATVKKSKRKRSNIKILEGMYWMDFPQWCFMIEVRSNTHIWSCLFVLYPNQ